MTPTPRPPTFMGTSQVLPKPEVKSLLDRVMASLPPMQPFLPDEFHQKVNQLLQRTKPGQLVQYLVTYGYLEHLHNSSKDLPKISLTIGDRSLAGYQRPAGCLVTPLEGDDLNPGPEESAADIRDRIISELNQKITGMLNAAGIDEPGLEAMMNPVQAIKERVAQLYFASAGGEEVAQDHGDEDHEIPEKLQLDAIVQALHLDRQDPVRSARELALSEENRSDFEAELAGVLDQDPGNLNYDLLVGKVRDLKSQQATFTGTQFDTQFDTLLRAAGVRDSGDVAVDYEALLARIVELQGHQQANITGLQFTGLLTAAGLIATGSVAQDRENLLETIHELMGTIRELKEKVLGLTADCTESEDPGPDCPCEQEGPSPKQEAFDVLVDILQVEKEHALHETRKLMTELSQLRRDARRERWSEAPRLEPNFVLNNDQPIDLGILQLLNRLRSNSSMPVTATQEAQINLVDIVVKGDVQLGHDLEFHATGYDVSLLRFPVLQHQDDWLAPIETETQDLLLIAAWNHGDRLLNMAKVSTLLNRPIILQNPMVDTPESIKS